MARAAKLLPPKRILGCVCFAPSGLKINDSFKNNFGAGITDSEIFALQKCRSIIETAGPEIGDHFYQYKL